MNNTKLKKRTFSFIDKINILFIILILVSIELIDTLISNLADFQYDEKYNFLNMFLSSQNGVDIFIILSALFIAFQFVFLYKIKDYLKQEPKVSSILYQTTIVLHFVMISILLLVTVTMIIYGNYNFILSKLAVGISFTTAAIIFLFLSKKLFEWFSKIKDKTILIFAIAFLFLGITKILFELGIFSALYNYNQIINFKTIVEFPDYADAISTFFANSYWVCAILSFFLLWLGIVALIRNYKEMIGRRKYLLITILSLAIFIPTPIGIYLDKSEIGEIVDPVVFYTFTTFNATLAAIFFFITFFTISRYIREEQLKKYLLLTGIGLLLYFISDQATIEQHAYPPYGLISIIFLGFSAYLVFVGLYSSAVSASRNTRIRNMIFTSLKEQFLYNISIGEFNIRKTNEVNKIIKNLSAPMNSAASIEPLTQGEISRFIDEAINQLQEAKIKDDIRKGYYLLNLSCIKCHKINKLQINLSEASSADLDRPRSELFKCIYCSSEINLGSTQDLVKYKLH